eukprot:TRINITY_DN81662_c0_g1_i1.p1 TRINITY_DN81662_c0_g1~~TRINITY_DN81662_c0_g1_i1.p1  ORF type:complete len:205 (-),score=44.20 TRINITY_DN81662_c0_g1_i1:221-835(-)
MEEECGHCFGSGHDHEGHDCGFDYCARCESGPPCYHCRVHTTAELELLADHVGMEIKHILDLHARGELYDSPSCSVGPEYPDNPQVQLKWRAEERRLNLTSTRALDVSVPTDQWKPLDAGDYRGIGVDVLSHRFKSDSSWVNSLWSGLKDRVREVAGTRVDVSFLTLYVSAAPGEQETPLCISVYIAKAIKNLNIEMMFFCDRV